MSSNDYYRDLKNNPFNRRVLEQLFGSGYDSSGFPNVQQAMYNTISDINGTNFAILSGFTITYGGAGDNYDITSGYIMSGGNITLITGSISFLLPTGYYLYISGDCTYQSGDAGVTWPHPSGLILCVRDVATTGLTGIRNGYYQTTSGFVYNISTPILYHCEHIYLPSTTGYFLMLTGNKVYGQSGDFTKVIVDTGLFQYLSGMQVITGVTGKFGITTGVSGKFNYLTGYDTLCTSADITTLTGRTTTGVSGRFTYLSGVNTTGTTSLFLTHTGVTGNFTYLSGTTTTGTTGWFNLHTGSTGIVMYLTGYYTTGTSGGFGYYTGLSGVFNKLTGQNTTGSTGQFGVITGGKGTYSEISGTSGLILWLTGATGLYYNFSGNTGHFNIFTGTRSEIAWLDLISPIYWAPQNCAFYTLVGGISSDITSDRNQIWTTSLGSGYLMMNGFRGHNCYVITLAVTGSCSLTLERATGITWSVVSTTQHISSSSTTGTYTFTDTGILDETENNTYTHTYRLRVYASGSTFCHIYNIQSTNSYM